jgi:hypothetical protein
MRQEQGLWDLPTASPNDTPSETIPPETEAVRVPVAFEVPDQPHETALGDSPVLDLADLIVEGEESTAREELLYEPSDSRLAKFSPARQTDEVIADLELSSPEIGDDEPTAPRWNLRDLRLRLRFHRADLYLVVAIVVSTFAMIWVLSATPVGAAQRKPRLSAWEKALVSLGLADLPEPAPRRGNPNIQVWVDPKTALYYCVDEDLYGKAPGGHATTQGEAQMDQYEPASRAACE